jgi:hypothetical protein
MTIQKLADRRLGEGFGAWIRTGNGGRFYYESGDGSQYDIDVAAAALSRITRYAGHLNDDIAMDDIYCVAQHSVYVYELLKMKEAPVDALPWAICHDVPEAYFVDLPSPLKSLVPKYGELEERSAESFRQAFGIPYNDEIHEIVKWADYHLYFAEARVLSGCPPEEFDDIPEPDKTLYEIDPQFFLWRPAYARYRFQQAFIEAMALYRGEKYADAS